jgi:hypothetical protein
MDEEELNSLRQLAARLAQEFAVEATVDYDRASGFITVKAITRSGGGDPRKIDRSAKFQSRELAEALIDQVIRTASAH